MNDHTTLVPCPRCLGEANIHGIECPTCSCVGSITPKARAEYLEAAERDTAVTVVDPGSEP